MTLLQNLNLALRFSLEICGLIALGYWGFHTGNGKLLKVLLGIGTPLFIAVIWGVFGSPKAVYKVSMPLQLVLELLVFGLPAIALYFAGKPQLAWIYAIIVIINRLLMFMWKQ
jgi:hypothetical protein